MALPKIPATSFRQDRTSILLLILVHALWFCGAVFIWKRPYSYDSAEYIQLATNLQKGFYYSGNSVLPVEMHLLTLRPPLYAVFIGITWMLFGKATWILLLLQNIISIASCILIMHTFRRFYPDMKSKAIYWVLILLYPMQMVFANMVFCDILLQFFLMLYIRQLLFFQKDPRPKRFLLMSVWLIAAVLTKPIVYPFLFLHGGYALWCAIRSGKLKVLVNGVLPLVAVMLYGLWNYHQTGLFHISSIQSYNLLEYNVKEYYLFKYGPEETERRMDGIHQQLRPAENFGDRYRLSAKIAAQKIREELPGYLAFHLLKSAQLFFDPNKLEFDIFTRQFRYINNNQGSFFSSFRENGWRGGWLYLKHYPFLPVLLLAPLTGLIRLLGFLLFLFQRKNDLTIRILMAVFVLYFAAVTGPVANARYFLPLLLVMSACAWIGYSNIGQHRSLKQQNRRAAS